ncbi:hypothetical protein SAMN04487911_10193 [Arenibacter nanhaiticus]|uniref:Uncharacterized protein n=1 Tax=Arenibacter nanhaiticus TaxID=558155 RepID=A0A1M6A5M7_9FLAO|nr:DUF6168 family protein [Arenibacter nanhaiticus]SHI31784.1 hypothetical protein SAMN04487911_10193 [Arenibacter nanhaiticus]
MVKRLLSFLWVAIAVFVIGFLLHNYLLQHWNVSLRYNLFSVYLFHFVASSVVYLLLEFVYSYVPDQVGYGFLMGVFIKIGVFVLVFQTPIFYTEDMPLYERLPLVLPLFMFLGVEVWSIAKLLNLK